jgi:hypothetical protein
VAQYKGVYLNCIFVFVKMKQINRPMQMSEIEIFANGIDTTTRIKTKSNGFIRSTSVSFDQFAVCPLAGYISQTK